MRLDEFTTRAELSAACRSWEQSWVNGPDYDNAEESASPESVLAVLRGESAEDDLYRGYEALDEAGIPRDIMLWLADDYDATREILALILSKPGSCPEAQRIIEQRVKELA